MGMYAETSLFLIVTLFLEKETNKMSWYTIENGWFYQGHYQEIVI